MTRWIQEHGVIAVFLLMGVDAVLPVGGELIMLFAGVMAAAVGGLVVLLALRAGAARRWA